ncbi:MAG TPA: DUF5336 domain-containing protein, partial [Mycobacterium sp.]|nr:DUF5336 domain-containing protein [Mycobacterium sp.]
NIGLGVGLIGLSPLLAAALVAAFGMLPKQSGHEPVVAGLSVSGFVSLFILLIGLPDAVEAGVGLILVLVSSFLQAALAVGCVLLSAGVVKSGSAAMYGYANQGAYGPPLQPYQTQPYPPQPSAPQPFQPPPQVPYSGAPPPNNTAPTRRQQNDEDPR